MVSSVFLRARLQSGDHQRPCQVCADGNRQAAACLRFFTPAGALRQSGEIASRNQRYLKWPMTIGVMAIALV
jgi:hypothetical protein